MAELGSQTAHPLARDASVSNTEDVYMRLREMLLNGEIAPGTVLSQVRVARELGVSTTPLREAMRLLQAEGLLVAEHNRRARVASLEPEDIDAVSEIARLAKLGAVEYDQERLKAAKRLRMRASILDEEVESIALANPKSRTFTLPSAVTFTFAGLRSR